MRFRLKLDDKHLSHFGGVYIIGDCTPTDSEKIEDAMLVYTSGGTSLLSDLGGQLWAAISDGELFFDLETIFGVVQSWPDKEWDRPVVVEQQSA